MRGHEIAFATLGSFSQALAKVIAGVRDDETGDITNGIQLLAKTPGGGIGASMLRA